MSKQHHQQRNSAIPTACSAGRGRGAGQGPQSGARGEVSATATDFDTLIVTCLFLWLPCFYSDTRFPFTVLLIIFPFKINLSGNGESIQGKTRK